MKKAAPYILLAVLALLVIFLRKCQQSKPGSHRSGKQTTSQTVDRDHGFDRRTSLLQYSSHAKCRMECRHISQAEVEQTMQDGAINYTKSDIQNSRCPRYALETVTKD
ncbi:MAG TPA: DUF4258 domain-containing protein, partial [Chitinophagaceae bacterium]